MQTQDYQAVVIGGSAGSMEVLLRLFSFLPVNFRLPIIIVCHLHPLDDGGLVDFFRGETSLVIKEARDKEELQSGCIYFPPANYHLLVEPELTLALSVDPKVNYSRPSIDVLFDSAAAAFDGALIGIILTGANKDGALGIKAIKDCGGFTIAQDPVEADYPLMPQAAINTQKVDRILSIDEIGTVLRQSVLK